MLVLLAVMVLLLLLLLPTLLLLLLPTLLLLLLAEAALPYGSILWSPQVRRPTDTFVACVPVLFAATFSALTCSDATFTSVSPNNSQGAH